MANNVNDKVQDKAQEAANTMDDYHTRHPRRMLGGALVAGAALGAGLMAAKKSRDKNALQKFMDQIGH